MPSSRDDALHEAAIAAAKQAYAPYSGLSVGAALRSASGNLHRGCNVENGALPIGGCAERAAIASAVLAEGAGFRLSAIAVAAFARDGTPLPVAPCGACRQALIEFGPEARVEFLGPGGWVATTAHELLPHRFVLPDT
ncbi:MAG TPA: cytidine deaminase [Xanthomonadales bacterium]|nr:cytidine deaminase [Xanthomonadales bacterium]